MTAERMSAEELERALAFLEHHERGAFPQRSESQAASSVRAHIAAIQREADGLRHWKAEALAVEAEWDVQAVAAALGLKPGDSIRARILPAILQLQREAEEMREALEGLVAAVVKDSNEHGISGYTGARLSDARAALSQARGEPSLSSANPE